MLPKEKAFRRFFFSCFSELFFYFDEDNGEVISSAEQMNLFLHDSDDNIR